MGSKRLGKVRESVVAAVSAGTMKAKDAYDALGGGAFTRGEFEVLQAQAARSNLGLWRNAPAAEKKAAMAYQYEAKSDTPSKSDQRAKALGMDVREYAQYGKDGKPLPAAPAPSNAMVAPAKGYALQYADNTMTEPWRKFTDPNKTFDDLNKPANPADTAAASKAYDDYLMSGQYAKQDATQAGGVANFGFKNTSAPVPTQPAPLVTLDSLLFGSDFAGGGSPAFQSSPTQMANNVTGDAATAATGNNLANNPAAQAGLVKSVDQNGVIKGMGANLTAGGAPGTINSNGTSANPLPAGLAMLPSAVGAADSLAAGGATGAKAAGGLIVPGMAGAAGTSAGAAAGGAAIPAAAAAGAVGAGALGAAGAAGAGAAAAGGLGLVDAAIIGTGLVGAAGSIYAGMTEAEAATKAAELQKQGNDAALAEFKRQFDSQRADLEPWRQAGLGALDGLKGFEDNNPQFQAEPFQFNTTGANADPSYTFRFNEGVKALQNSAAARGNLLSGNTLKGITQYGQEAGSQEYSNAFSRYQTEVTNRFNRHNIQRGQKLNAMQSLAGVGQSAVQQMGNASQNYATNAGNAMTGGANAQAQGVMGASQAKVSSWSGGASALSNALGQYINYNQGNTMNNAMLAMMGRK